MNSVIDESYCVQTHKCNLGISDCEIGDFIDIDMKNSNNKEILNLTHMQNRCKLDK